MRIPVGYITTPVSDVYPGDVLHIRGKVGDVFENPGADEGSNVSFVFPSPDGGISVEDYSHVMTVRVLQYVDV